MASRAPVISGSRPNVPTHPVMPASTHRVQSFVVRSQLPGMQKYLYISSSKNPQKDYELDEIRRQETGVRRMNSKFHFSLQPSAFSLLTSDFCLLISFIS